MIVTEGKTVQQVLNELAAVLIEQGKRCSRNKYSNVCLYGDGKGNHCAIGWLLPEDRDELMDHAGSIGNLIEAYDDLGPNDSFIRENKMLLTFVQKNIHDAPCPRAMLEPDMDYDFSAFDEWFELVAGRVNETT